LPQRTIRSGPSSTPNVTQAKPVDSGHTRLSPSTSKLARPTSHVTARSLGLSTSKSEDARKSERDAMPPPPSLGRSQSLLRRPTTTHIRQQRPTASALPFPLPAQRGDETTPKTTGRAEATTSVSTSGLSRSSSTRIPGSPASTPSKIVPTRSSHLRAQSVTTSPSVQNIESSPARTGLPESARSRSRSSTTSTVPELAKAKGPSSSDTKLGISGPREALAAPSKGSSRPRPVFSTLQQHFSPAKSTGKPPLPSSRPVPSGESPNFEASFETTKLQAELLHLSLLHQEATVALRKYDRNANESLRKQFELLKHEKKTCEQAERTYQETLNTNALAEWAESLSSNSTASGGMQDFAEAVRSLSSCFNELIGLSSPQGRYSVLVKQFTVWIDRAEAICNGEHATSDALTQTWFVDALSAEWHDSHSSISQRLRLLEREVGRFPPLMSSSESTSVGSSESALARVITTMRSLTPGMRRELDAFVDLERLVLSREARRVDEMVEKLRIEDVKGQSSRPAAWHTVA